MPMAHLHHSDVRIKVAQQIVSFLRNAAVLVANAEVDSQILRGALVILEKSGVRPVVQLQGRISHFTDDLNGTPARKSSADWKPEERCQARAGLTTPPRNVMLPRALPYAAFVTLL